MNNTKKDKRTSVLMDKETKLMLKEAKYQYRFSSYDALIRALFSNTERLKLIVNPLKESQDLIKDVKEAII